MGHTVGIDLGTAYSAIAWLDHTGIPRVLPNAQGEPVTASVLSFPSRGVVNVGELNDVRTVDPAQVITAIKRQMGRTDAQIQIQGQSLTPEFVSALILRKLKQDAEQQIGEISRAVITVPYYFNEACRKATRDAGQIAGLQVLDVINEPTAATLAYAWSTGILGQADDAVRHLLLYDLGGGTFDVTIVACSGSRFTVLATDGDTLLGGIDWTNRLRDEIAGRLQRQSGRVIEPGSRRDWLVRDACERAKRKLSRDSTTHMRFEFDGKQFEFEIPRRLFEELTADLLQRTQDTVEIVMHDAGIEPVDLTELLLVGGSTHMPAVQTMLEKSCGKTPSRRLDPRLAVAEGAAIHAAILEARDGNLDHPQSTGVLRRLRSIHTQDVNSHSLGVEISDPISGQPRNHIMIPRNTRLPAEITQRFVTNTGNPDGIRIRLLEGEVSDASACTVIGDFRIRDLPAELPVGSPVEVVYRYDERKRIHVSARELVGQRAAEVKLVWESGISPDARELFQRLAAEYALS